MGHDEPDSTMMAPVPIPLATLEVKVRRSRWLIAIALSTLCLVVCVGFAPAAAQGRWDPKTPKLPMAKTWAAYKTKLPPYRAPRTADGSPDLQGFWGGPGGGAGDDMEEHEFLDQTTPPQESYVADPSDGKIPYTTWALAKRNEHRAGLARGWSGETGERLYADPASFCLNMIGPRVNLGEIIQRSGSVIMVIGTGRGYRIIPTDGRPHVGGSASFWRGNSRGRWEGETLVIEVARLNGRHWFDSVGNFYSENTRMTERLTMVDANTIDYSLTVEDPTIYTRPWTMNYPVRRAGTGAVDRTTGTYAWREAVAADPDPYAKEVWENSCNEGVGYTIEGLRTLGFKWFRGVTPPR